eukprot:scaffold57817_cov69-Attheya_sp.AAC.1
MFVFDANFKRERDCRGRFSPSSTPILRINRLQLSLSRQSTRGFRKLSPYSSVSAIAAAAAADISTATAVPGSMTTLMALIFFQPQGFRDEPKGFNVGKLTVRLERYLGDKDAVCIVGRHRVDIQVKCAFVQEPLASTTTVTVTNSSTATDNVDRRGCIVGDTDKQVVLGLTHSNHAGARVKRGIAHLKHMNSASVCHVEFQPTILPLRSLLDKINIPRRHDDSLMFCNQFTDESGAPVV